MRKLLLVILLVAGLLAVGYAEKVVNYGIYEDITTTNLWNIIGPGATTWNFTVQLWKWGSLLGMNKDGMVTPGLAADVPELVKEGDYWTVTVPLRKDVKWSDGVPFTADDVVFTYNTVKELKIPGGNWSGAYEPEKVEKIDDYTVKFYFKEKKTMTIFFDTLMTAIAPKHFWEPLVEEAKKKPDPAQWLLQQETVEPGVAALNITRWEKGAFIEASRVVDDYWAEGEKGIYYENGGYVIDNPKTGFHWESKNPKPEGKVKLVVETGPFIDRLVWRIFGNRPASIQALLSGDISFIPNPLGLTAGELQQVQGQPGIEIVTNPALGFRYIAFNLRKYPMNVKEFRQAIAALIDRDYICNRVLQGKAIPLSTPVPPANSFWYNPNIKTLGEGMNRAERYQLAIDLLKKAGFSWLVPPKIDPSKPANPVVRKGKGLRGPDGKLVPTITLLAPSGEYDPMRATTAIYIEQWANDIGIPIEAKLTDFNEIVDKAFIQVDFDIYMLGWGIGRVPTYFKSFWYSKEAAPQGYNTPGYNNPEFDALIDEFERADNFEQAREVIMEAQELLAEDLPYVVLFTTPLYEAYRADQIQFPFTDALDGIQNYYGFPESVKLVK
ncbi:MAG: ABC transporter substrate-binding protein [Thermotogae bacterium]|nr:ABC transporter substrate-binding protein [Thermotogota bacterium]